MIQLSLKSIALELKLINVVTISPNILYYKHFLIGKFLRIKLVLIATSRNFKRSEIYSDLKKECLS